LRSQVTSQANEPSPVKAKTAKAKSAVKQTKPIKLSSASTAACMPEKSNKKRQHKDITGGNEVVVGNIKMRKLPFFASPAK
jgi:hypothetical protein